MTTTGVVFNFDVIGEDSFGLLDGFKNPAAVLTEALTVDFTAGRGSTAKHFGLSVRTLRTRWCENCAGHFSCCCREYGVEVL